MLGLWGWTLQNGFFRDAQSAIGVDVSPAAYAPSPAKFYVSPVPGKNRNGPMLLAATDHNPNRTFERSSASCRARSTVSGSLGWANASPINPFHQPRSIACRDGLSPAHAARTPQSNGPPGWRAKKALQCQTRCSSMPPTQKRPGWWSLEMAA